MAKIDLSRRVVFPDLANKRVLITGAGAGIGRVLAVSFAHQNCRLILNDVNPSTASAVMDDVAAIGSRALTCPGSVTNEEDLDQLFLAADREFGGVDVLINNAGIRTIAPTLDISVETWNACFDVNLTAPLRCAQRAASSMVQHGGGVILNVSSIYGLVAVPERAAYCAAKAGLVMVTKVMAIEWAKDGIRVNAVAPGHVRTPYAEELFEAGEYDVAALERRTPSGRLAMPEDIADLAMFLASDAASSITGQVVAADGGWTAYGYL